MFLQSTLSQQNKYCRKEKFVPPLKGFRIAYEFNWQWIAASQSPVSVLTLHFTCMKADRLDQDIAHRSWAAQSVSPPRAALGRIFILLQNCTELSIEVSLPGNKTLAHNVTYQWPDVAAGSNQMQGMVQTIQNYNILSTKTKKHVKSWLYWFEAWIKSDIYAACFRCPLRLVRLHASGGRSCRAGHRPPGGRVPHSAAGRECFYYIFYLFTNIFHLQESLLLTHLMENYDREVRPVINASQAVVVRVGITLTQIFDMVSRSRYIYCAE